MKMSFHRVLNVFLVVFLTTISGIAVCADTVEQYGVTFELPSDLLSARRLIADANTADSRKQELIDQITQLEQNFQKVVDFLTVPDGSEEKGGMSIGLDPVEDDDVSDEEYMNQVWEAMLRMAPHLDDPATQYREFVDPSESFGFYRMDVSNAYGSPGDQASFLTKNIGERYLMVIIMTDGDSHADRYNNVLASLQPASKGHN